MKSSKVATKALNAMLTSYKPALFSTFPQYGI